MRQYQNGRDPRAPLFRFKTRALVHFAADPDKVRMSTRIGESEIGQVLMDSSLSNPKVDMSRMREG